MSSFSESVFGDVHCEECYVRNEIVTVDDSVPIWISRALPQKPSHENVVALVLPGIPGLTGFYHEFMEELYQWSGQSMEIIGFSYPGHYSLHNLTWATDDDLNKITCNKKYSLRQQSRFISSFIKDNLASDTKLILIGHSAGAFVSLELLEIFEEKDRIKKVILLFPALENVDTSPAGQGHLCRFLQYKAPILCFASLVDTLPTSVRLFLIKVLSKRYNSRRGVELSLNAFFTYEGILNIVNMAREVTSIRKLQHETTISQNLEKITFYYGQGDLYVPVTRYDQMKERFPGGDIRLCQQGIKHAFNMYSARDVSEMVWDWCLPILDQECECTS